MSGLQKASVTAPIEYCNGQWFLVFLIADSTLMVVLTALAVGNRFVIAFERTEPKLFMPPPKLTPT